MKQVKRGVRKARWGYAAWARWFAFCLGLAWAGAPPARAIDTAAGTGGASFMQLGLGTARAAAMGRAFVALAEGTDALGWNPAGLALTQTRELTYSYMRFVQGIDAPLYMGYAHPLGRTVLGANLAYLNVDGFEVRDSQGRPLNNSNVRVNDGFATVSAARSFWYEKLFVGASLKGIYEDNAGARRGNLVGDLGAILKPTGALSLGFSSQNFGNTTGQVTKITRFGSALRMLELLTLSLELSKPSDNGWKVGFGGEFVLPEELLSAGQVSLRAGYYSSGNQGTLLEGDRHVLYPLVGAEGVSFGLGLFSSQAFGYGIGVDYAIVPMGALGLADHLSLKVKF